MKINEMSKDTNTDNQTGITSKTLKNSTVSGAKTNMSDLVIVGNDDMFQLLHRAHSKNEGWTKSTKAMQVGRNCVVQVTTQLRNPDGSYTVAEAITTVPDCTIVADSNDGRKLTPRKT